MRSTRFTIALVPAALLTISLIGCTDNNDEVRTPSPDARSTNPTPQPANQDRATTGAQKSPASDSVHDVRSPSVDARSPQPVPQPSNQDRTTTGGQPTPTTSSVHDVRTPSVDARPSQPVPQPSNQDRATTGGQPTPTTSSVHDVRTPSVDARPTQPIPQPADQDRTATGVQSTPVMGSSDANRRNTNTQNANDRTTLGRDSTTAPATRTDSMDEPRAADNTGLNKRDRNDVQLTPMDQGSSDRDLEITQSLRQAVVDAEDMSVNAQNVKIITQNGVVTLRGPVASASERTQIASMAERMPGVTRVENQMEVAAR